MRTLNEDILPIMNSLHRNYRYKVELWDIMSDGAPSIRDIISGDADKGSEYYLDVTSYVTTITLEDPGDGRAARASFQLVDSTSRFNPDYGDNLNFIQINQVVRIVEGDASVDEESWVVTFTGHIMGQVGFTFDRSRLQYITSIVAYNRMATPKYIKKTFISNNYGKGIDYGDIIIDIATTQMQLNDDEIERIETSLGKSTQFEANSIVDLTPIEAINKILETVGKSADFDGEGKLRFYNRNLLANDSLIYNNLDLIQSYSVIQTETETYNSIRMIGLDKNISMVEQPQQVLARASIPVGFWRPSETAHVQWSRDNSLVAINTSMVIQKSVNDAIIGDFGSESYQELDEFSGVITVNISDYVYGLITLIMVTLFSKALIGDIVVIPPLGGITTTISYGRLLQVAIEIEIYLILATISTGQYDIVGTPLLPVYKEIEVVISEDGVPDYLLREKEIRNDWLNTQEDLVDIGQIELIFENAQGKPREINILNDLRLEIGDIIKIPIGEGIRIWIDSIYKVIQRGITPIMRITGYKAP